MQKKLAIVGRGQFSEFIKPHLEKYFEVLVFPGRGEIFSNENILNFGGEENLKKALGNLDYLVLCVPLNGFEDVCKKWGDIVSEKTVVVDVTSVKVKPIKLMKQYFLNNRILGTHPIFGPQSGKNGIEDLPIVLCNVSLDEEQYLEVRKFFSESLKLNVIEKTEVEHDKEMALVQGLSHFIGRVLKKMDIQDFESATKSYKQLINLKELVGNDTFELYKTIQNGNPYTDAVREEFLQSLQSLENDLRGAR